MIDFLLISTSALLGIALAMDAFSVSVANGLAYPDMKKKKAILIAATFAFFQALMPLIGYLLIRFLLHYFRIVSAFIPYIALILLSYLGIRMIIEDCRERKAMSAGHPDEALPEKGPLGFGTLAVQGIATSIDALSAGLTMSSYSAAQSLVSAVIISAVTFVICIAGVVLGKKFGNRFRGKAQTAGGIILIIIGLEIFIKSFL